MIKCFINDIAVDNTLVSVNSTAFGRPLNVVTAIPFVIELNVNDAIQAFGDYYQDFISRESEDAGDDEVLPDHFLALKNIGYLTLEKMFVSQPELLGQILEKELAAEFLGYIFLDQHAPIKSKKYILQNLIEVKILNDQITCIGRSFVNQTYSVNGN